MTWTPEQIRNRVYEEICRVQPSRLNPCVFEVGVDLMPMMVNVVNSCGMYLLNARRDGEYSRYTLANIPMIPVAGDLIFLKPEDRK